MRPQSPVPMTVALQVQIKYGDYYELIENKKKKKNHVYSIFLLSEAVQNERKFLQQLLLEI
jgi:hypothetical protein